MPTPRPEFEMTIDYPRSIKPVDCTRHGGYTSRQFTEEDIWTGCPICRDEADTKQRALDNQQLISENKVKQVNRIFENSCIPPRFKTCSFENYIITNESQKVIVDKVRQYANDFPPENSPNMLFLGNVGTGKTHLANALANKLIKDGYTAFYAPLYAIMDRIYESGFDKHTELAKYIEPDFLIIDEVLGKANEDTLLNLFKIIDSRYMNWKPTCIISNITIDKLIEVIGERIADRLLANAYFLDFGWESYRGEK